MRVANPVADLAEVAVRVGSRAELRRETLERLNRLVGFDFGIVFRPGDDDATLSGFDASFWQRFRSREASYAVDLASLMKAASGQGGVTRDVDALCSRRRDASPFYQEIIRPIGSAGFLTALIELKGRVVGVFQLGRAGRAGSNFREQHSEALRQVLPVLALAETAHAATLPSPSTRFSPREAEIVRYLALGFTNREIALACATSTNTVRNQVASIFRKAEVTTRSELVAWSLGALER